MSIANYTGGFPNGVLMRGVPILQTNPGKVFWVNNSTTGLMPGQRGGSDGNRGGFNDPFATLAYAITQCVANRGDIIFIKPGHAETIVAAGLAASIAGVAIIGLGIGNNRPTLTFGIANTATITVSAANVSFQNIKFISAFLSVAAAITLTTAKYFTIQQCDFFDTAAATDFLQCIKGTGAANTTDGLYVADCRWFGTGVTSVTSMILIADAMSDVTLLRNRCVTERTGDFPILYTQTAGATLNLECGWNSVISKQTASTLGTVLGLNANSTGVFYNNYSGSLVTASDILFTTTVGIFPFESRVSGVVGKTGFVMPAVDS